MLHGRVGLCVGALLLGVGACAGVDPQGEASESLDVMDDGGDAGMADDAARLPSADCSGDSHDLEVHDAAEVEAERMMDELSYPLAVNDPLAELSDADRAALEPLLGERKAVQGADSRVAVANPTNAPYASVAQLLIAFKRADGTLRTVRCTGSLVRADAVLTAGHCLYTDKEGWAKSVRVIPAMTSNSKPFGESSGRKLFVPSEYRDLKQVARGQYDFGIVRTHARLGERAGTRKFAVHKSPQNQPARIIGYAGDRPNTMLESNGKTSKLSGAQLLHDVDAFGGTSGAGVVGSGAWANTIFAIHSGESSTRGYNVALVITTPIHTRLKQWAEQVL